MKTLKFSGFPKKGLKFFEELTWNNDRDWFQNNKHLYEKHILEPAKLFIADIGKSLIIQSPYIVVEPKINKSIFRIYRDVRFSKNKLPYKTHLGIWMRDDRIGRNESSGYYFHLEADKIMLGVGMYMFSKDILEKYRDFVYKESKGKELMKIMGELGIMKDSHLGGKHYKRVPNGYEKDYKYAELLLYNGLYAGVESSDMSLVKDNQLIDYTIAKYKKFKKLHDWLMTMVIGR